MRHLFTYQRLNLGLLNHVSTWGKVGSHICLHTTSFVYISEANVWFIYTTWPTGARSATIILTVTSRRHWPRHHIFSHHVNCDVRRSRSNTFFTCVCIFRVHIKCVYKYLIVLHVCRYICVCKNLCIYVFMIVYVYVYIYLYMYVCI